MPADVSDIDEEDIVFDRASLLPSHGNTLRLEVEPCIQSRRKKLTNTVLLCAAFFSLGICYALPGPTLIDLEYQTNSSTSEITNIYFGRSLGYLGGSIFGGILFDKLNASILLSLSLLLTAVGTLLIPWSHSLITLMSFVAAQGVSMGFMDTGGNVVCLQLWDRQSGPYMQSLHFSFGIGAFSAPLLAETFLDVAIEKFSWREKSDKWTRTKRSLKAKKPIIAAGHTLNSTDADGRNAQKEIKNSVRRGKEVTNKFIAAIDYSTTAIPYVSSTHTTNRRENKTASSYQIGHVVVNTVQFSYGIVAIILMVLSAAFALFCCCFERTIRPISIDEEMCEQSKVEGVGFRVQILALLFVFYFFYVGMEITYGGLITNFAHDCKDWHKSKAIWLNSVYWGFFTAGRGIAIFMSKFMSSPVMLIIDLVVTTFSFIGILITLEPYPNFLWLFTATAGLGMASIFPTGIMWAERYMQVTGKSATILVVGSALGEMALPKVTGLLYQHSPMYLMYTMLTSSILAALLFIIMQNLASNKGDRYSSLQKKTQMNYDSDDYVDKRVAMQWGDKKRVTFKLPGDKYAIPKWSDHKED